MPQGGRLILSSEPVHKTNLGGYSCSPSAIFPAFAGSRPAHFAIMTRWVCGPAMDKYLNDPHNVSEDELLTGVSFQVEKVKD